MFLCVGPSFALLEDASCRNGLLDLWSTYWVFYHWSRDGRASCSVVIALTGLSRRCSRCLAVMLSTPLLSRSTRHCDFAKTSLLEVVLASREPTRPYCNEEWQIWRSVLKFGGRRKRPNPSRFERREVN